MRFFWTVVIVSFVGGLVAAPMGRSVSVAGTPTPISGWGDVGDPVVAAVPDTALAADEALRAFYAALTPPQTQPAPVSVAPADGICDGFVIPGEIVWKESRCDFGAVSPDGQYVGAYQFDRRHWDAGSSWGGCADLGDWSDATAQHECARRLSRDGTYLRPWGA